MARKPREGGAMEKVMIRLPPEMLERIEARIGGRGIGEEIRGLLAGALATDPQTGALIDGIKELSVRLEIDANWWDDRFIFEAFKAGVLELLAQKQPQGEPVTVPGRHIIYGEGDDPATAGRVVARQIIQDRRKGESD